MPILWPVRGHGDSCRSKQVSTRLRSDAKCLTANRHACYIPTCGNSIFQSVPRKSALFDPTIGRWQTKDPKSFDAGDTNLYRYVGNHPSYATDPSGLEDPVDVKNVVPSDKLKSALVVANRYVQSELERMRLREEMRNLENELFYLRSATPTLSSAPRFANKANVQARYYSAIEQIKLLEKQSDSLADTLGSEYADLEIPSMTRFFRDDFSGATFEGGRGGVGAVELAIFLRENRVSLGQEYSTGGGAYPTTGPEDFAAAATSVFLRNIVKGIGTRIAAKLAAREVSEEVAAEIIGPLASLRK